MTAATKQEPPSVEKATHQSRPEARDLLAGRDVFAIYWRLLALARAERRYIDSVLEVELFERAMEIATPAPPGSRNSTN